jgi:hypothetical protein
MQSFGGRILRMRDFESGCKLGDADVVCELCFSVLI